MKIESEFAILDVLGKGRVKNLKSRIGNAAFPLVITIRAEVVGTWGSWDGTSQEFELKVIEVKS